MSHKIVVFKSFGWKKDLLQRSILISILPGIGLNYFEDIFAKISLNRLNGVFSAKSLHYLNFFNVSKFCPGMFYEGDFFLDEAKTNLRSNTKLWDNILPTKNFHLKIFPLLRKYKLSFVVSVSDVFCWCCGIQYF